MVTHTPNYGVPYIMAKTTIELADDLAEKARAHAARRRTTLRSLIERGLRLAIAEDNDRAPFKLSDQRVSGQGMDPDLVAGGWEAVRARIYRDQGE